MLHRRLLPWLFALTLLLGQAAAFAHAIGHLHKSDGGLPDPVCEVCVAQANLGSAAPASVFSLAVAPAIHSAPPSAPAASAPALPGRAQARAPPFPV